MMRFFCLVNIVLILCCIYNFFLINESLTVFISISIQHSPEVFDGIYIIRFLYFCQLLMRGKRRATPDLYYTGYKNEQGCQHISGFEVLSLICDVFFRYLVLLLFLADIIERMILYR